jgi:radical SAM superfamily enzyme YgiQ (UPF0313 family)
MKIDIVVVYIPRYRRGHEADFVPPITGIHLAAITPSHHQVRVVHQQVQQVNLDTDADLIALSFFSGFTPEAYRLADIFRAKGKMVVAGGPHASFWPEEVLQHCDAVMTGEAESVWEQMLSDAENRCLRGVYNGSAQPLETIPTPRYDLLPNSFFVKKVIQATRGCPFTCSFCSVPKLNPGFRVRPIADVIRDVSYDKFPFWWQNKIAWFWDDNLTAQRSYVKALLKEMIPLKKWWLTQASMDIVKDPELMELLQASGCIGVFFGIESFNSNSLMEANKRQNKMSHYREIVDEVHKRGIAAMGGFIAGFDHDTADSVEEMADNLQEIGIDVPFMSILTPYKGTPLYEKLLSEDRILKDRGWEFYNGFNVAFKPNNMSADELLQAHRALWSKAFSPKYVSQRISRAVRTLNPGSAWLSLFMNGFYGVKRLRKNEPIDMMKYSKYRDAAVEPSEALYNPR